ncbi:Mu-like prophage major head subunit gpT family protein [Vibrio mytili]|uniref:Mu-like prophage major head subunit gpT family protein n=1 Tax=Vibrio mytili TaxID=50718 RepID=UPI002F3EDB79
MTLSSDQIVETLHVTMSAAYTKGLTSAKPQWDKIATRIPSAGSENYYGGLKNLPGITEWVADRQLAKLGSFGYSVKNKTWESSIQIGREEIEDDQISIYGVIAEKYGEDVALFPDSLSYGLLVNGFTETCLDGAPMFSSAHPLDDAGTTYSNVIGDPSVDLGAPWFLMDTSQVIKPIIYQERRPFVFKNMNPNEEYTWFENAYVAGTDGRCNVGFGFPKTAIGSKATLNEANYEAAIKALGEMKRSNGTALGVRPTTLVVGYANRAAALKLINREINSNGESNIYYKDVDVVVSPYIL